MDSDSIALVAFLSVMGLMALLCLFRGINVWEKASAADALLNRPLLRSSGAEGAAAPDLSGLTNQFQSVQASAVKSDTNPENKTD